MIPVTKSGPEAVLPGAREEQAREGAHPRPSWIERLRRITRDGRWIPEIDSLRFIAIVSVVAFHMHRELLLRSGRVVPVQARYSGLANLLDNGNRGVQLFFVISGFILGLPFARQWLKAGKPVALGKYFLRRVTRLEPPYIASYLVAIVLFGVFTRGAGMTRVYLEHLAAGMVYLNGLIFRDFNPVNSVTWSLEIEIQFYLVAPLLALLFRIRNAALRRTTLVLSMAALGVAQITIMQSNALLRFTVLFYAQYFLAGLLLADLYLSGLPRASAWWDALAVPGWFAYFTVNNAWSDAWFPFLLILLCMAAMRSRLLRWFFGNPWVAIVGGMCYSIYLLHFLLIAVFFKVTRRFIVPQDYLATFAIQMVVTIVPVLLLCAVYYIWVERVCMDPDWPSKLATWMRGGSART
ncbi:MAG TPA: acyltransferase [Terracidiphilus sp.]|nr:acyltransferase [Terracidiphilus sp.]